MSLPRARAIQISSYMRALEEGAWDRLDRLPQHYPLPRKQSTRLILWTSAMTQSPDRVEHTLRGWAWLRTHKMTLDATSLVRLFQHVMEKAPATGLTQLLDDLLPRGQESRLIPGDDGSGLLTEAIRRHDPAGLRWLFERGVDLDPSGADGLRFPTLQRVLEIKEIKPSTATIIEWMLDHGVRIRELPLSTEKPNQAAGPLDVLVDLAWRRNMADPDVMAQVQRLWELLEASGAQLPPAHLVDSVPLLKQWLEGRNLALQRQAQVDSTALPSRRRLRS